jgi:MFS family permease
MTSTTRATARGFAVVFVGLQLGMLVSTLDGTIVATALPSIVHDLGGVSGITWVVTAYLLAQVATMPLYGKIGDLYGRKRVLLVAIGLFTVGSMACGVSHSMGSSSRRGRCRDWAAAASVCSRWRSSATSSRRVSSDGGSATRA